MLGFNGIALDVGGVIYYDEPFELAWLQGTFEIRSRSEAGTTLPSFLVEMEEHYRCEGGRGPWDRPGSKAQAAELSWAAVRESWADLVQLIPGALDVARDIASRVPTVIVANQPPECLVVLREWGLTDVLVEVFLDSLAGVAKPDPGLLELGRARLGLPPHEVLMVGNRVDHDVRPARALGCAAAFVRGDGAYRPPPGVSPDIVTLYERLRPARTASPREDEVLVIVPSLGELAELAEGVGSGAPEHAAGSGGR